MGRLTAWLATLPSTNARIAVTLLCVVGTSVRYWSSGSWSPSVEWLAFLASMSGLDTVQFFAKRKTDHRSGTAGPPSGGSSP